MRLALSFAVMLAAATLAAAEPPKPMVTGLKNPVSIAVGPGGKLYYSALEGLLHGQGSVGRIENGRAVQLVSGLKSPMLIAGFQQWLFVADDDDGLLKIDAKGKVEVFAPRSAFSKELLFGGIVVDPESGLVYVSDLGGSIYRITPKGKTDFVIDRSKQPDRHKFYGMALDGQSHLLVADDSGSGELLRIKLADGSFEKIAEGLRAPVRLSFDYHGRLYICDVEGGRLFCIPRPGLKPVVVTDGLKHAYGICYDPVKRQILVVNAVEHTLTAVPINIPGHEVDESPLPLHTEIAFPNLQWTGWEDETKTGKVVPLRPIVLTHAGDGSDRVFVATQHGVVHSFPNDQKATKTNIFLDIQDRVSYRDDQNEEGFLGLAFHPKFKENGEFFVFYTPKKLKQTNVVSRFRLSKDDPNRADPASEEEILRFSNKPFWNHDGGTICFGPDGYLYVTHGDGGSANDPYDNGQKLSTWFGKVLRIDVDRKDGDAKNPRNYAIPKDNPFVDRSDAKPEIWAYGVRNIWRMAFDRKTGNLWAGDVGQNLYEEIDIIVKGGNYGWNRREGLHPFGAKGTGPRKEFIEPIWEYHHDIGKSITSGTVYRGPRLPELDGMYLYADYVSGKIWALRYDETKGRVVANRPIKDRSLPIMSFGEDEKGEVYLMYATPSGKGIYWFVK